MHPLLRSYIFSSKQVTVYEMNYQKHCLRNNFLIQIWEALLYIFTNEKLVLIAGSFLVSDQGHLPDYLTGPYIGIPVLGSLNLGSQIQISWKMIEKV